jgi:hypothetical protein
MEHVVFWATHSRLAPIIDAARTLKRHEDGLLSYLAQPITNTEAERLKSRVQAIRVSARGYRNREHFKTAIYFHLGELALYPQIHRIAGSATKSLRRSELGSLRGDVLIYLFE